MRELVVPIGFNQERVKYTIYTESEAKELGLPYVYWKEAREAGQWILNDAGEVAKTIRVREWVSPFGKSEVMVYSPFGKRVVGKNTVLLSENKPHWVLKHIRKTEGKDTISAYVAMRLSKQKIDYKLLGNIYRPDSKFPVYEVKRFLRQPQVREVIGTELEKRINNKGFTVERVLDDLQFLIQACKDEKDLDNLKDIVFKMMDMHNMVPKVQQVNRFSMYQNVTPANLPPVASQAELDAMDASFKEVQAEQLQEKVA